MTPQLLSKIDEWVNVKVEDVIQLNTKVLEEKVIFCPNPKLALDSSLEDIKLIEEIKEEI